MDWPATSSTTTSDGSFTPLSRAVSPEAWMPMTATPSAKPARPQIPHSTTTRCAIGIAARLPQVPGAIGRNPAPNHVETSVVTRAAANTSGHGRTIAAGEGERAC